MVCQEQAWAAATRRKGQGGPLWEKCFLLVGIWPNSTNWITAQAGAAHRDEGSACSENRFESWNAPVIGPIRREPIRKFRNGRPQRQGGGDVQRKSISAGQFSQQGLVEREVWQRQRGELLGAEAIYAGAFVRTRVWR